MKITKHLTFLLSTLLIVASCGGDDEKEIIEPIIENPTQPEAPSKTIITRDIVFPPEQSEETIMVNLSGSIIEIQGKPQWLTIPPAVFEDRTCKITICAEENKNGQERTCSVVMSTITDEELILNITQKEAYQIDDPHNSTTDQPSYVKINCR